VSPLPGKGDRLRLVSSTGGEADLKIVVGDRASLSLNLYGGVVAVKWQMELRPALGFEFKGVGVVGTGFVQDFELVGTGAGQWKLVRERNFDGR
jgi:hypothetical protein